MNKNSTASITWILFALALFSSCGNFENIEIGEPDDLKIQGFEENFLLVNVDIPIYNPTIHRIRITELDVQVFLNGKYIGKLMIDEKLVIYSKEKTIYKLPLKVRLNNLLGAAFIMMNLKKGHQVEIKFEGEVTAKSLLLKKTIEVNETRRFII